MARNVHIWRIPNPGSGRRMAKEKKERRASEGRLAYVAEHWRKLSVNACYRSTISESQPTTLGIDIPTIKRENETQRTMIPPVAQSAPSFSHPGNQEGTHIGYTTELEPILFDMGQGSIPNTPGARYQRSDDRNSFLVSDMENTKLAEAASITLPQIEDLVGPHGPVLMEDFRVIVNRNFPIIHNGFFQAYHTRQRHLIDPALLSAAYLIAFCTHLTSTQESVMSYAKSSKLEEIAIQCFGASLLKPNLSTIQAGLLLMQRPNIDSKTLHSQLVGVAHELGLHLDSSTWSISAIERSLRKRLAWALYMQDKWCSLIHGRPSSISHDNWAVWDMCEDDYACENVDGHDDKALEDITRGRELFHQLVMLTRILSMVLDTFYTLKAMHEIDQAGQGGVRVLLERAKPVQIRLKEWFTQLPKTLKMDEQLSGKPTTTGYLHLAYFATEITLHRCIVRSLQNANSDPYLTHVCRSAAKTRLISAMDFVNRLRPEHLSAFWYFPSRVNFALVGTFGSLLLATAPCQEEADFYHTRLAEYRWTLSVSSRSAEFLTYAIQSLDSHQSLLQNLPPKPSTLELAALQAPPPPVHPPGSASGEQTSHGPSPPSDRSMADAAPSDQYPNGTDPARSEGGTTSGLMSPSTSTSDGSAGYEAYVQPASGMGNWSSQR